MAAMATTAIATLTKDYRKMIETLDNRITQAEQTVAIAEAKRRTAAFEASEDEDNVAAQKRLQTASAELEKAQKRLDDLKAAREEAATRADRQDRETAEQTEAKRKAEAAAAHKKMMAAVRKAEKAVDDAAAALAAARDAKNEFCRAWPPRGSGDVIFAAWNALDPCLRYKLRGFGLKPPPFMTADQSNWMQHFPDLARLGLEDAARE
ncbi:MAG: hypothetical protein ACOY3L_14305 [Pseudomonadota bacterium]